MILVKDHKTTGQADTRRRRQQGSHYIMQVMPGFPRLLGAPSQHARGQTRVHTGAGMCCFWALVLWGAGCSPTETNISSILGFIFLTVSERAAIR